jgi:hypothetical protein
MVRSLTDKNNVEEAWIDADHLDKKGSAIR